MPSSHTFPPESLTAQPAVHNAPPSVADASVSADPSMSYSVFLGVPESDAKGAIPTPTDHRVDKPADNTTQVPREQSEKMMIARENLKKIKEESNADETEKKTPKGFSAPFRQGVRASAALSKTSAGYSPGYSETSPAPWDEVVEAAEQRSNAKTRLSSNAPTKTQDTNLPSIPLGAISPKGPLGWPREMEAFCSAEMPSYPVPSFADNEHADRTSFLSRVLRLAAHEGREDIAQAAVSLGAPLNAESSREGGPSLLGEVCSLGDTRAIALLLSLGAEVDEGSGTHAMTPLMWAALSSKPTQVARLLLQKGAQLSAVDDQGRSALIHALASEKRLYAEFLVEQIEESGGMDWAQEGSRCALAMAAALGVEGTQTAKVLLEFGAPTDSTDGSSYQNRSALEWSLARNNDELVRLLLLVGADRTASEDTQEKVNAWKREKTEPQSLTQ